MDDDAGRSGSKREWEQSTLRGFLDEYGERKERFETPAGREIDRLATPEDLDEQGFDYGEDLGYPGEEPFTRGVYPTMHRGRLWTRRQLAGFGTPEQTNERNRYLLEEGSTGLNTTFDMPTLMGLDSDDPMAEGEVGMEGVAVDTLRDMELLFEGIPIDEVSESLVINSPAPAILGMYVALADEREIPRSALAGTTQNDLLKEFHAQNEWILPPRPSVKVAMDIVEYAAEHLPKWSPISISGYHVREAGSTAAQEVAFTIADGLAYVEEGVGRGMAVESFVPQLSFFFNADNAFFEEVAKFRAARRVWAREMRERYDPDTSEATRMKFHVQTSGAALTAPQPKVNLARVTQQAMAAIVGGAQSIHTNGYDEALGLPTAEAMRLALRTQQVLVEEAKVADSIDPLGGSYHVESLTTEIESEVESYLDHVENTLGNGSVLDGVLAGIDSGYFRNEIRTASYEHSRRVEAGSQRVVGVNAYEGDGTGAGDGAAGAGGGDGGSGAEADTPTFSLDAEEIRATQLDRLERVKAERDAAAVEDALRAVRAAAEDGENVMPAVVEAVSEYATEGEVMDALADVFGRYRDPAGL